MKEFFDLKGDSIVEGCPETANIVIYALPTDLEKKELYKTLHCDHHSLESALDPDEISRVEFTADHFYIIWKRPNNISLKEQLKFEVSPLGIFLKKDKLMLILGESTFPFKSRKFHGISSLNGLVLRLLLDTTHHFLGHLRVMRQINAELQVKLNASMENQYLLQMFNLSESLIYYLNALEGNAAVLAKLRTNAERLGFSKEEIEMLDDIIIDHQQCVKQTEIYSSILSGLMDARGNIINNNMNVLLKNLTMINIVFLPLNLIASVGGMSEYTRITEHFMNWKLAYLVFFAAMALLGVITWSILVKQISKQKAIKINGFTKVQ